MSFHKWLIHRCIIQKVTTTQLSTGELSEAYTTRTSAVECRFVAKRQQYANESTGEQRLFDYLLLLRNDQTIETTDRITSITLNGGSVDTGPYKVIGVLNRNAMTTRHKSVALEKVK